MLESKATITDGKDAIHATAIVGVDLAQKGMQMPQKFGSASSYGKKYALGNLFLIDDTKDADATNTHNKAPKAPTSDKQWPVFTPLIQEKQEDIYESNHFIEKFLRGGLASRNIPKVRLDLK